MTEIEKQALALINEVRAERGDLPLTECDRRWNIQDGYLCRAIECHEVFEQGVSDAVRQYERELDGGAGNFTPLRHFIIPKPDPLAEAMQDATVEVVVVVGVKLNVYKVEQEAADRLRKALADRGLEIVEKKP